jgi:hypothetical protein
MGRTIDVPLRWVEDIATLVLPEKANQHLQQLMDRNNEGCDQRFERGQNQRFSGGQLLTGTRVVNGGPWLIRGDFRGVGE